MKGLKGIERLQWALLEVSSMINGRKNLDTILEFITRESLNCLNAHRSTIFFMDEESGFIKTQFSFASDRQSERVGLIEEKEVARKTLKQGAPGLLREPRDFSEFFKYEDRKQKIISLISIPLTSQDRAIKVLSVALVNKGRRFNEKDLQFLSIFGNHASIALKNDYLLGEVHRAINSRKTYEAYLDEIIIQLQRLYEKESQSTDGGLKKLLPEQDQAEKQFSEPQVEATSGGGNGDFSLMQESGINRRKHERLIESLRVEFEDESWAFTDNLSCGGAFIRMSNPMDLGEQFPLQLHLPDGHEPIAVACKVIWTNQYGKEDRDLHRGMGVKFLNLQPEMEKRIEEFIKARRNKKISTDHWNAGMMGGGYAPIASMGNPAAV